MQFVHLHNHTHYSLLDGASTVQSLVNAAVANHMPAVALTDHGVLFGAIEFYKRALKAGIKPIIGCEAYIVTKGSRFEKKVDTTKMSRGEGRGIYNHIVLLAKDSGGYKNLIRLCTLGHTEGFYFKPRIDVELLAKYHDGIIATSACQAGIVNEQLVSGNYDEALEYASIYRDIFDEDFYLEIQNHGLQNEQTILADAPRIARELGLKIVATNDCHYILQEHAIPHNIMLYIPEASSTNTPDYQTLRYRTDQLYFKSSEEMCALFKEFPEAIQSTLEITDKCNLKIELKKNYMPAFPIPSDAGMTDTDEYFEKLVWEQIPKRYEPVTPEIKARVVHEINVIKKMGYAGYFLIVQDFIRAAREMSVRVGPGRGSAAGSIVSYALGITDVDPLKYDLLFERFLNPDRVSMPDIDIDFADNKRERVIEYVKNKYGEKSVAQIVTFGTMSARAALKDVGRVLGIQLSVIDSITKQIPVVQGKVTPIEEALKTIPDLKWVNESTDEKIKLLIDTAKVLEGMNRNLSTHAAGVVIAPGDISDYVPMYKSPQTDYMTQYNMKDLEDAGLLKMDFLGLRTLTVIDDALLMIEQGHHIKLDLDKIPEADEKTLELFTRGQTVALFQFESTGMQDYLRKLKPTSIHDLVAMNALYRPGPMGNIPDFIDRKHGKQKIVYLHPKLEPILRETYGIIVYQEQVIKIASEIGGLSLAQADLLRRAMGKKDKELMAKQKKEFVESAVEKHVERKIAAEIYDLIEKFAAYGFNKSHSVAYSVLAYQTAYLKAQYPAEYMAATLSSEMNNTDKIVVLIDECRKLGIEVMPPDVNESDVSFIVTSKGIRFGLSAIKNVGTGAVEQIVKARSEKGRFKDIFDFCVRVDLRLANKKTIEGLIQAGAFDSLHQNRAQIFSNVEAAIGYGQDMQEQIEKGQSNLFDVGGAKITNRPMFRTIAEWPETEKLSREKAVLGFYVSGHPLMKYRDEIDGFSTAKLGEAESVKPNSTLRVCGIISDIKKKIDKRNRTMAFVTIEDFTGKADCIVFADAFQKYAELLQVGSIVMMVGKNDGNEEAIKVIVNEVLGIDEVRKKYAKGVLINMNLDTTKENDVFELVKIIEHHQGKCQCYLNLSGSGLDNNSIYLTRKYTVDPSRQFIDSVKKLLGPESVRLRG
ncbi:MAG: DNA polymerase III subunit alpha [Ignavibacteriae bacterium]|nr:MAG: DNA polymerase III subunit alpha [Ignavibacteriota bacterium]